MFNYRVVGLVFLWCADHWCLKFFQWLMLVSCLGFGQVPSPGVLGVSLQDLLIPGKTRWVF